MVKFYPAQRARLRCVRADEPSSFSARSVRKTLLLGLYIEYVWEKSWTKIAAKRAQMAVVSGHHTCQFVEFSVAGPLCLGRGDDGGSVESQHLQSENGKLGDGGGA